MTNPSNTARQVPENPAEIDCRTFPGPDGMGLQESSLQSGTKSLQQRSILIAKCMKPKGLRDTCVRMLRIPRPDTKAVPKPGVPFSQELIFQLEDGVNVTIGAEDGSRRIRRHS